MRTEQIRDLKGDLERIRRQSEVTGPSQQRVFRISISKFEYVDAKSEAQLEGYAIYVYTPAMIAIEKLRAICQQMAEYAIRARKTSRARDFYDIHAIVTEGGIDLATPENLRLIKLIFSAKEVPLELLKSISKYRSFHEQDWPSVVDSVSGELKSFDFYFDFVLAQIDRLESLWIE